MSEERPTKLYTALLAAMRDFGTVKKDRQNPAFRSSYATLHSILEAVEGPLNDHGLILVQRLRPFPDGLGIPLLVTDLIHAESGQTISSEVVVVCQEPNNPQKMGGAITYYRRYSLLTLLNLTPEEDDDGNTASQPRSAPQAQRPAPQAPVQQRPPQAQPAALPAPKDPRTRTMAEIDADRDRKIAQIMREEGIAPPAPMTQPEFVAFFQQQQAQFLKGTERSYILGYIQDARPRFSEAQYEASRVWWKAFAAGDEPGMAKALALPAPMAPAVAGVNG